MLEWKTEGTRLYQGLPERLRGLAPALRAAARDAGRAARAAGVVPDLARDQAGGPGRRRVKRMRLQSYAQGSGSPAPAGPTELFHAVTGEKIAEATSEGLDFKGMLEYARRVGGPKLRAMTFHQRARMLKAMAQHLMARKEELYQVSAATGATKADSWIDIEGGIGTFFAYASQGRREFPDETFYVDGPVERISKGGTFLGRHLCVPLEGVAVHINAFNFPCWGMLEKLAPTFLAGMPAIVKPATVTSYLTERMARSMVERGDPPGGRAPAHLRRRGRPARPPDLPGRGHLHRLGRDRPEAQEPPARDRRIGAVQPRSRLAQLLHPRPRCRAGLGGVRSLRQGSGEGDDRQGGAEVHRHPANHRAGGDDRGRGPGALQAARRRHAGRPGGGRGPDGAAGRPGTGGRGRAGART